MRTGNAGTSAGNEAGARDAWESVRAQSEIQFEPVALPEPEPPGWLQSLLEALAELLGPVGRFLAANWPVLKWVLLAAAIAALLYLLWTLLAPSLMSQRSKRNDDGSDHWVPDREQALALLEDADRLAETGRYDEAAHLLLQRSVDHLVEARPAWIEPSSTARGIAAIPALPEAARTAFATIAGRVERSLFALHALGEEDWQAARPAYSDFTLADLRDTRA